MGIKLLDIPAEAQQDPRAQIYVVDHVNPGTEIQRRVLVSNASDSPQTVRLYAAAAKIVEGRFMPADDTPNELSTWIKPDKDELELEPGQESTVPVIIDVPSDAPEAEQYAAIWAEVRSEDAAEGSAVQANRAGIRVYLSVGPGNGPPADFDIGELSASRTDEGTPTISTQVENTGGRAIDVSAELNLTNGPDGLSAGPFTGQGSSTIAPGATGTVSVPLSAGIPNGPWDAALTLTSGLVEHEATARLQFPEVGSAPVESPSTAPALWWILGGIAVVALLILAFVLGRRRSTASTA